MARDTGVAPCGGHRFYSFHTLAAGRFGGGTCCLCLLGSSVYKLWLQFLWLDSSMRWAGGDCPVIISSSERGLWQGSMMVVTITTLEVVDVFVTKYSPYFIKCFASSAAPGFWECAKVTGNFCTCCTWTWGPRYQSMARFQQ
jgi:hypothetical protein